MAELVDLFPLYPPQFGRRFRVVDVVGGHGGETHRSVVREVVMPIQNGGVENVVDLVVWLVVDVESVEVCYRICSFVGVVLLVYGSNTVSSCGPRTEFGRFVFVFVAGVLRAG